MRKLVGLALGWWLVFLGTSAPVIAEELSFTFYSEVLTFTSDPKLRLHTGQITSDSQARHGLAALKKANYQPLLAYLQLTKTKFALTDWFYLKLVEKTAQSLIKSDQSARNLLIWFLLGESGYQVKLAYSTKTLLVLVRSDDQVYSQPYYFLNGEKYLGFYGDSKSLSVVSHLASFQKGKPFRLAVNKLPQFPNPEYKGRHLPFTHGEKTYHVDFVLNKTLIQALRDYPQLDLNVIQAAPLSEPCYQSLIPAFRNLVAGLDSKEAVGVLLSFVRTAFRYQEDEELFGKEKVMTPEEALASTSLDCEDKSGLFYYLVKEVLNLPVILIDYPDYEHVNVGVSLAKEDIAYPIEYDSTYYAVCETTEASNREGVGENTLFQRQRSQVLNSYLPDKK